ncbi:hypothetical protein B296_00045466 [Ensete ventricosum]|uniref:Uncharacterized protein n=1 Tax=Ensete ventricosum TaxID=4639 RepID=A0A426X1B0_ENSVE|nr:hypothetical protein B296_00045466 [Ensete ventricosum]
MAPLPVPLLFITDKEGGGCNHESMDEAKREGSVLQANHVSDDRLQLLATTSYSPPSLCARVARSDWRSFAAEIHHVDTAREEDA